MFGVQTFGSPEIPSAWARSWSERIQMTLGLSDMNGQRWIGWIGCRGRLNRGRLFFYQLRNRVSGVLILLWTQGQGLWGEAFHVTK